MRASSPNVGSPVPAVASPAASPPIARLPARARWLTALAGVLGTAALGAYYSTVLVPLPADNATAAQVVALGLHYRVPILIDVVLQIGGSALSVIFALALIHLAGTAHHLAGRLAVMTGAVVLGLSLAEGTFALGVVQAATNRHPQAALACFDLTNVFVHVFLLAPSLFLLLGLALWNTTLLPLARSCGEIAAEMLTPYPPGIPVLAPGERITRPIVEYLRAGVAGGMHVTGASDPSLATVRVVGRTS